MTEQHGAQVSDEYDVVVSGGGTAGAVAALAAARQGASVAVVESEGFLGGNATTGLPFLGFWGPERKQIVAGIAEEIVNCLMEQKASPGHIQDPRWYSFTPFNPAVLRILLLKLLVSAGVSILFHSATSGCQTRADGGIGSILATTVSGTKTIKAGAFIDCTGDAAVARFANAPVTKHQEPQSASLVFRLGGFSRERFVAFLHDNPTEIRGLDEGWTPEWYAQRRFFAFCGLFSNLRNANAKGLALPREFICFNVSYRSDEVNVVATQVVECDGTDAMSLSSGEITAQFQAIKTARFLQEFIPGFEDSYIVALGHRLGIRETFRLVGEYILNEHDILSSRPLSDTIALGSWPIDIHSGTGKAQIFQRFNKSYAIPYRCLWSSEVPNLLVAGRCISTTHEAHGSTRTMAQCMATGQAAGTAAAMAVKGRCGVGEVSMQSLRERLESDGAILDLPHLA